MRQNKKRDMTPYDMTTTPKPQNALLRFLMWAVCMCLTRRARFTLRRVGMEGVKPPFLVIAEHQGFADYYIIPLVMFPYRTSYISDIKGFATYGKGLCGAVSCIPTRRFIPDPSLVRRIRHAIKKNRDCVVLYPEARHSNVGTNSAVPISVGKLVRLLGVPVAVLKANGSYLDAPIWNEKHRRHAPLSAELSLILTAKESRERSPAEITALLNEKLTYDAYRHQAENRICIKYPKRAEGLHKMLYKCPHCFTETGMMSAGATLSCGACGRVWEMDTFGQLCAQGGKTMFAHIPDWYEWERAEVAREIAAGGYVLDCEVKVEALPNDKGFVPLGKGRLTHAAEGFRLVIAETGQDLFFASEGMPSVHNEYDYKAISRGDVVVLSTADCCYYLYHATDSLNVTKVQLAAEHFYDEQLSPQRALADR